MKLEKRNEGGPSEPEQEPAPKGKKPVIIYIMVLFTAAFLLMAWSFASHQRSNTEALGRLQSSVAAMQGAQELQEQTAALQTELEEAREKIQELESAAEDARARGEAAERQAEGMSLLYRLQQQYAAQDYAACRQTIAEFDGGGYAEALSQLSGEGVTPPAERYQELKEAVEAREAEASEGQEAEQ